MPTTITTPIVIDNGMINTRMHVMKTRGFRGVVNTNAFPGAYYLPGDFMLFADYDAVHLRQ